MKLIKSDPAFSLLSHGGWGRRKEWGDSKAHFSPALKAQTQSALCTVVFISSFPAYQVTFPLLSQNASPQSKDQFFSV